MRTEIPVEELISLLDSGLATHEVVERFSDEKKEGVRHHLDLFRDLKGAGESVRPPMNLLKDVLSKISILEESVPAMPRAIGKEPVTNFVRQFSWQRLLLPAGAIAILAITVFNVNDERGLVSENTGGEEFMALTTGIPETALLLLPSAGTDAAVKSVSEDLTDLFDEAAIEREAARADADFAAADAFFASDDEVQAALAEF